MTKITESSIKRLLTNYPHKVNYLLGNNLYLCKNQQVLVWRVKVRKVLNGTRIQTWKTLGTYPHISIQEAVDHCVELNEMVKEGYHPTTFKNVHKNKNKTFGAIANLFYHDHIINLSPNTIKAWEYTMQQATTLNHKPIAKIKATDIHRQISIIKSKSIAAGLLQRIKQLFKWAEIKLFINENVAEKVQFPYKTGIVERYLSPNEISRFFGKLLVDEEVKPRIKVAIYSLLVLLIRKSELLNIRWDDVDLGSGRVVIQHSKAIEGWIIKLPRQILQLWIQLRELYPDSTYVFESINNKPYSDITLNREINKLIKKYKVQKWSPHDLRRTGMTLLSELGQRYEVINAALGHVVKGVNRHYLKSNLLDERTKLLQVWVDYIESQI